MEWENKISQSPQTESGVDEDDCRGWYEEEIETDMPEDDSEGEKENCKSCELVEGESEEEVVACKMEGEGESEDLPLF